jgi:glycosyltransferase involved in cell wall biosynthesis
MDYLLISSAYNEESTIKYSIESIIKQTVKPVLWLIVNDGSKDGTGRIIEEYTSKHDWIIKIDKKNDNIGIPGQHAMINLYYAIKQIPNKVNYNFIGHLDIDIIIDRPDYYEYQIKKMCEDPTLGICGGIPYYFNNNKQKIITDSCRWHTSGGLKFYRKECFEDISPIPADISWDGIDEFKAMYKGWKTEKFFELEANHLGALRELNRNLNTTQYFFYGVSIFRRGRPMWFAISKSLKIMKTKKLRCGILYLHGYFKALINAEKKLHTKEEIKFVKRFDRKRAFNKYYPFND